MAWHDAAARLYHSPAFDAGMLELKPAPSSFALRAASFSGEYHCLESSVSFAESASVVCV